MAALLHDVGHLLEMAGGQAQRVTERRPSPRGGRRGVARLALRAGRHRADRAHVAPSATSAGGAGVPRRPVGRIGAASSGRGSVGRRGHGLRGQPGWEGASRSAAGTTRPRCSTSSADRAYRPLLEQLSLRRRPDVPKAWCQLLVAEVAVEAEGPLVAVAHPEVHAGRPVGAEEVLQRRHQPPTPARALGLREQVDVEVRRVARRRTASSARCGWWSIAMRSSSRSLPPRADRVALAQRRPPLRLAASLERAACRGRRARSRWPCRRRRRRRGRARVRARRRAPRRARRTAAARRPGRSRPRPAAPVRRQIS